MTSEYNGLIPDIQKPVELSVESWKYGTVEKGKRQVDPLLNWGALLQVSIVIKQLIMCIQK